ncbi:hypothetical protein SDC9_201418 [bioreactor metagenome]|uniref:Uncharacterized protein n=1 Tax=bioreactor metagenome TaxID=1076179 RepID=A0A645ISF1_9ZZZZ
MQVVFVPVHYKGKIQVAHVVEYGAAARYPARELPLLLQQEVVPAFRPGVLVLADDHRIFMGVKIQDDLPRGDAAEHDLFQRERCVRVVGLRGMNIRPGDHRRLLPAFFF